MCCYIVAERMSERAEDDVRGEQRRAARQQLKQQQQIQRGEGSTAMATVAERRSLPSPEIMLGQSWSSWLDGAKLHGNDGEFACLPVCAARRCRNVCGGTAVGATRQQPVLFSPSSLLGRLNAVLSGGWNTKQRYRERRASATTDVLSLCGNGSFFSLPRC